MSVHRCSVCGDLVEEFARGGGPDSRRCADCIHDGPPSPGTLEHAEMVRRKRDELDEYTNQAYGKEQ